MLRLLRTTTFRFTVVYVLVFAIAVAILGVIFYQSTFGVFSKQTDAIIDQEIQVLTEVFGQEGAGVLRRVVRERAAWRDDGLYMLIGAPSGAVLSGNLTALPPEAVSAAEGFFDFTYERARVDAAGREAGFEIRKARGKIRRFKASVEAETAFLVFVARDISDREALRQRSQAQMTRIGISTIGLGLIIGLISSRSLLRRVDSVNKTARAIRDGDLSKRVELTGTGDELDNLAINLNAMLDQIERLMTGMKEVSDNIAHDLRSPLTRIRARLADALTSSPAGKEKALKATLDDAERMIDTFNALLSIARIESGEGAGAMEAIDLVAIAQEMAELYEPAAQDTGFQLDIATEPCPPVRGSRALVSQAVANLLDNALKYAKGGTRICIAVSHGKDGKVHLSILDDGPGIPEQERSKVLRRFVRLEVSRSSRGSGLGLSLVTAIARAHDAELVLSGASDNAEKRGLKVMISFNVMNRR